MFDRIPVKIIIQDKDLNADEILEKFKNETIFYPKQILPEYFSILIETLSNEKDPLLIINNFMADIAGQLYFEITVHSMNITKDSAKLEMVYNQNIDFKQTVSMIISKIKSKAPVSFFDKIVSFKKPSKEKADLYFIDRKYKEALSEYDQLHSQYPELSRRMCEICRMILGYKPTGDPLTIDILIFYKKYDDLFDLGTNLPIEIRIPVFLYLSKSDLCIKKRLISSFYCYCNFKKTNNESKSKKILEDIFEECSCIDSQNQEFLSNIKTRFF